MSTYRVALCEDEAVECRQITAMCRDIFAAQGVETEIVPFSSADALRQTAEEKRAAFDLYLLDIQMEGTTGLELAQWLYDQGVRDRVIFITGNPEYALAGYEAHPLHYLLKPVSRERLEAALGRALERHGAQAVLFQRGGKAPCNSTGNGVKLAWKHKLRQAAGCWHTPRPCTSDGTTQHSNPRIAPQAYYTHLSFLLQGGGWAFGRASAWRNARRC